MSYNLTFMNESNNILEVVQSVNTASNGLLGVMILVTLFIAVLVYNSDKDINIGFMTSSFVTGVVGSLMFFVGLLAWTYLIIPIVLLMIGIMIRFTTD